MTNKDYIGKRIQIKSPAYKNGRKHTGIITGIKSELTYFVKIDGNSKSSTFAHCWITLIEN